MEAADVYFRTMCSTASRLSRSPRIVGKTGSSSLPARSRSHASIILIGVAAKRRAALLSSFALATDVCAGSEHDVTAVEVDQLRYAQTGLQGQQQDRAVPAAYPCRLIRCREQRVHLSPIDEVHRPAHIALARHGEDALAVKRILRLVHRHVAIERADRGKTRVSAAGAVATDLLDMGEEVADECGIKVLNPQLGRWPVPPLARVAEQQSEGVAIACNRVRAGLQLRREAIREESLEQCGSVDVFIGHAPVPERGWLASRQAQAIPGRLRCTNRCAPARCVRDKSRA